MAKRGWIAAVAAGILGFSATAGTLVSLNLSHAVLFFLSMLAVYLTIRYWPVGAPRTVQLQAAWWDVPSRMLLIAGLVLGVTYLAPLAGPSVSGVIASFPFMGAVLAVFAHRTLGGASAIQVLRGMLSGLYSFAAFFFVLSWALPQSSLFVAYGCAVIAALAVQGIAYRRLTSA